MLDRFERPIKIICLGMALLLAWQLASLILRGDPLARLKIPALPTLPEATNEPAKPEHQETAGTHGTVGTNALATTNSSTATNAITATNTITGTNDTATTNAALATNLTNGTNVVKGTNVLAKATNAPATGEAGQTNASSGLKHGGPRRPGMNPEMMAGGMPGGPMGGGMKPIELPPEIQARVDRIIDSEIFGPVFHPMPMALIGIADRQAYIRSTTGQTGPVKIGGEMGGIKLLRIGVNRVLVEHDGETNELTLFDGIGGESLMPKTTNAAATNIVSTNAPSTNAPTKRATNGNAAANSAPMARILSSKDKENP